MTSICCQVAFESPISIGTPEKEKTTEDLNSLELIELMNFSGNYELTTNETKPKLYIQNDAAKRL